MNSPPEAPPPPSLPKFAKVGTLLGVVTMNVSLPDDLKSFVESQVTAEGYGTSSEYVRELIRRDRQRSHLRNLIIAGLTEGSSHPIDDAFWAGRLARIPAAT